MKSLMYTRVQIYVAPFGIGITFLDSGEKSSFHQEDVTDGLAY